MKLTTKYDIEQVVYMKTDANQTAFIITEISIRPNNLVVYTISAAGQDYQVYEFEITDERNVLLSIGVTPQEQN